jgi:hypothetical protein
VGLAWSLPLDGERPRTGALSPAVELGPAEVGR